MIKVTLYNINFTKYKHKLQYRHGGYSQWISSFFLTISFNFEILIEQFMAVQNVGLRPTHIVIKTNRTQVRGESGD